MDNDDQTNGCADLDNAQSIECPLPSAPVCSAEGEQPQIVPDPVQEPALTVDAPNGTACATPGFNTGSLALPDAKDGREGALVGPSAGLEMGTDCNGGTSAIAEGSVGKIVDKQGPLTIEAEGPNARAGVRDNPGLLQIGAQANLGAATLGYDSPNTSIKGGLNAGMGLEGRVFKGEQCGIGADVGPLTFDVKSKSLCLPH